MTSATASAGDGSGPATLTTSSVDGAALRTVLRDDVRQRLPKQGDYHVLLNPSTGRLLVRTDRQTRYEDRRHTGGRMPAVLLLLDVLALLATVLLVEELSRRVLVMGLLAIALFAAGGLYRPRITPYVLDDLPSILGRAIVAGGVITGLGAFDDGTAGRITFVSAGVFGLLVVVGRTVGYWALRRARRSGRIVHRTLIIGCGRMGEQLAQTLLEHPEFGLRPVGFLDDDPLLAEHERSVPLLGGTLDVADVVLDEEIHNVVVAFGSWREHQAVDLLRTCDRLACEIFFVPRLYEVQAVNRDMEMVWGTPLVRMRRAPFRTFAWRVKRAIDVALSAVALLVLAPVLAASAVAVRCTIGRPVLFRQLRVGLDGRPFTLLKFCSLRPTDASEAGSRWTVADDDRLTRVGRFLRRTSLDELPQLWNVLRGDMSLVGPRPERPFFVSQFTEQFPRYMARHRVPSGLTGLAQVVGLRGDTSIADRTRFDNHYIENWSLWEDCKIMLRTLNQVVGARGR